jgi:hypothetical protein
VLVRNLLLVALFVVAMRRLADATSPATEHPGAEAEVVAADPSGGDRDRGADPRQPRGVEGSLTPSASA